MIWFVGVVCLLVGGVIGWTAAFYLAWKANLKGEANLARLLAEEEEIERQYQDRRGS